MRLAEIICRCRRGQHDVRVHISLRSRTAAAVRAVCAAGQGHGVDGENRRGVRREDACSIAVDGHVAGCHGADERH